jgi:hypothetical protein
MKAGIARPIDARRPSDNGDFILLYGAERQMHIGSF